MRLVIITRIVCQGEREFDSETGFQIVDSIEHESGSRYFLRGNTLIIDGDSVYDEVNGETLMPTFEKIKSTLESHSIDTPIYIAVHLGGHDVGLSGLRERLSDLPHVKDVREFSSAGNIEPFRNDLIQLVRCGESEEFGVETLIKKWFFDEYLEAALNFLHAKNNGDTENAPTFFAGIQRLAKSKEVKLNGLTADNDLTLLRDTLLSRY
jgi:hypothetical protein